MPAPGPVRGEQLTLAFDDEDTGSLELEHHLGRQVTLTEALGRYDVVSAEPDPGYLVMADRPASDEARRVALAGREQVSIRELGYTAPSPWTNWTRAEWNPKLAGRQGLREYYRMKRTDGTVRGALRLLKTPIQSARWFIEPASDSARDKTIAAFVEDNLFDNLNVSWSQILSDVLLMLEYGHMAMEKVWEQFPDSRIRLRKLAPRHPLDIAEWVYDAAGGPDAVIMDPNPTDPGNTGVRIPIAKLLVFSLEPEAGDLTGISVLRSAYKHWYYKDTLYKIDAIQKERHGIGVPIIKLPPNFNAEDRRLADELGRNLRTNERAHVVLPSMWEILFAKLEGQPVDCMTSIEHHTMQIQANILAPFMTEPRSDSSSTDMFLKSTRYIALGIADVFNTHLIKQLVDINFRRVNPLSGYPKLRVRRIGEWEDLRTMSFTFRNFVGSSAITPDDVLEDFLRRELDLPAPDHATARDRTGLATAQGLSRPAAVAPSSVGVRRGQNEAPAGASRQQAFPPIALPRSNSGVDRSGG